MVNQIFELIPSNRVMPDVINSARKGALVKNKKREYTAEGALVKENILTILSIYMKGICLFYIKKRESKILIQYYGERLKLEQFFNMKEKYQD